MSNAYISYTQTSPKQSKEIFVAKNVFFLLICLHFHLASHQEADIYGEKKFNSLNFEHTFTFLLDNE